MVLMMGGGLAYIFDVDIDRPVLSSKIPLKLLPQNLKAI